MVALAVQTFQFGFNCCGHFMVFDCIDEAPGQAFYPKKFFSGCLKYILGRLEMINQAFAKQISDPRDTFKQKPRSNIVHNL